jgi:hypothetical protein
VTAPGWYPDPYAPGTQRWWSGTEWTGYTAPLVGVPSRSTDGFAIASLVTSLVGLTPVGIVLGVVAKRRIRKSDGRLGGDGLATAGIVLGSLFLVVTVAVVALALNGVFDEVNSDDYSGEESRVAAVVDRFEEAYENGDGAQICGELLTGDYAGSYSGGCESEWGGGESVDVQIDIHTLHVTGDDATAIASEEGETEQWIFDLRKVSGQWRITSIE